MSTLKIFTQVVDVNEKAWALQEYHAQSPGSKGFRRYRDIGVNRDGEIAIYREDLGDAKKWKGIRQINIPSLWEHSVEELIELAIALRYETNIDVKDWLELDNAKFE